MDTTVERVDDTTVKLTVTVEAKRVDAAIDAAARELAGSVRIPGFRPGRVPRRVLESRLGRGALVQEAVRDALPRFYSEAVDAEGIAAVAPPELDLGTFEAGRDATFSATVEVRPDVPVPDYEGVQVPHPEWDATDEEVAARLEELRERFAEVEPVSRPARAGDLAVVTVSGTHHGREVEALRREDVQHEVLDPADEDSGASRLDEQLVGASAGAILKYGEDAPADSGPELVGQPVSYTVIVKQVLAKRLPDLDDDFAITASEFDTIQELREDVRAGIRRRKAAAAREELRGKVVGAVVDRVDVPLPKSMVRGERDFQTNRLTSQLEAAGIRFDEWLAATGQTAEGFAARVEGDASRTVKTQLVLDAVGRARGIEVAREDLGEEVARQAARLGMPADELARLMTAPEHVGALVADAFRRKVIDHLVDAVQVIGGPPEDPAGGDADADVDADADADADATGGAGGAGGA